MPPVPAPTPRDLPKMPGTASRTSTSHPHPLHCLRVYQSACLTLAGDYASPYEGTFSPSHSLPSSLTSATRPLSISGLPTDSGARLALGIGCLICLGLGPREGDDQANTTTTGRGRQVDHNTDDRDHNHRRHTRDDHPTTAVSNYSRGWSTTKGQGQLADNDGTAGGHRDDSAHGARVPSPDVRDEFFSFKRISFAPLLPRVRIHFLLLMPYVTRRISEIDDGI
jgi:hypothetical protein